MFPAFNLTVTPIHFLSHAQFNSLVLLFCFPLRSSILGNGFQWRVSIQIHLPSWFRWLTVHPGLPGRRQVKVKVDGKQSSVCNKSFIRHSCWSQDYWRQFRPNLEKRRNGQCNFSDWEFKTSLPSHFFHYFSTFSGVYLHKKLQYQLFVYSLSASCPKASLLLLL